VSLSEDGDFLWKCNKRQYVFSNNGNNLYTYDASRDCKTTTDGWGSGESAHIETVSENDKLNTKKEVKAAQEVRAISLAMGGLSMTALMETARGRRIEGLTFTPQDDNRAFRIYGPSLEMI
jgi:hypothetical protein